MRRLAKCLGKHAQGFHNAKVKDVPSTALQGDERWGYAGDKEQQVWEAEVIDPATRLVIEQAQGKRDEALPEAVLTGAHKRLSYSQGVVVFKDGEPGYAKRFERSFGQAYQPARQGKRGRYPKTRYRLGRRQAHVQIVNQRQVGSVVSVDIRLAQGSHKRLKA